MPDAGFSLQVSLSDVWNDLVSEIRFSGQPPSSPRTAEQLVLRKSSVAELAVRSRFRRLRFLRLFACEVTSGSTTVCLVKAARWSCLVLPTTFHFSSAFCPTFCWVPFPSPAWPLSQIFLCNGLLFCSIEFVFAAKKKHHSHQSFITSRSAVAERSYNALCQSAVSFSTTIRRGQSPIISYFGFRFTAAYK